MFAFEDPSAKPSSDMLNAVREPEVRLVLREHPTWQPIETAPKDGTRVLLFIPHIGHMIQIGYWWETETREYGKVVRSRAGWYWGQMSLGPLSDDGPLPTHWMAIPPPP